jgi:hypothetical protein
VRYEGLKLFFFWTASEWVTERGICDESRVRMRFWCHNSIVLRCNIVGRAIGEQRGYAAEILFGLIAHHKSMLCRPLLGGFRTYPFLQTCVEPWYLETCGTYDASLLNNFFTSRMADQGRGLEEN